MKNQQKKDIYRPQYEREQDQALQFLNEYKDPSMQIDETHGKLKYKIALQAIANNQSKRIDILIEDLESYFNDEEFSVTRVLNNTESYRKLFLIAADKILKDLRDNSRIEEDQDDLINQQRQMNMMLLESNQQNPENSLAPELKRKYDLYFIRGGQTKDQILSVRDLQASMIGSLVSVRGMVVRISDVKPLITVACYSCDSCGYEITQTVTGRQFTPKVDCESNKCKTNKVRGKLIFNHATSKFIPHQEVKIQELTEQLPHGSVPRTFTVQCKGYTNTRQCQPGDRITLQGVFLPLEKEGYLPHSSLLFGTYIEAYKINKDKKKYMDMDLFNQTSLDIDREHQKLEFNVFYSRMARSIAPEIFGMEDVKKALLLMMIGGVTKEMHDGMRIRGDINIALIGDPGIAKSQLLRYIYQCCPRAVYTTGKGSSSVGLTAAVIRDEITNELSLEGGALVMADKGVCCIDEFDKMNESDRTAIHEVMEQQTVSIAKAGITTTLNARTSILAAANPLYGRYNKKFTPHQNINLPAALLSRFDLIFILLDQSNSTQDDFMARHICFVHKNLVAPQQDFNPYSVEFIKTFIAKTKLYDPIVNKDVHDFIAEKYVSKRMDQTNKLKEGYSYTTPRTLLAVIRLSQALAKLRLSNIVSLEDVEEALRLMDVSQDTIKDALQEEGERKPKTDKTTEIYNIIKELCFKNTSKSTKRQELERKIISKGYTQQDLDQCLATYQNLNVILVQKNSITLVN